MARGHKTIEEAFGVALRELRARANMTQESLGFACDRHPTYISQLERGIKSPSLGTIEALAQSLKVRPHVLVKRADDLSRR